MSSTPPGARGGRPTPKQAPLACTGHMRIVRGWCRGREYVEGVRGYFVDERDSAWERDDARYRIYTFEGAANAVTTFDLEGATLEEALETAAVMSGDDERLWSLALVEEDARGLRGLIWLSGMDYNDPPDSGREWQRRRQMQDRYLLARSRRGDSNVLPNGLRLIRVFPEGVSGWPLWESFSEDYHLTGSDLGLSSELSRALYEWNDVWQSREVDGPVPEGWEERGRVLVAQLRSELAGVAEVRPEFLAN